MDKETIESFEEEGTLSIEKVINEYSGYIYKILQNSISNESDIEEILSDVFMIFWKKCKELNKKTKVKPYLVGIARNLIKKRYRDMQDLAANNEKPQKSPQSLANITDTDRKVFIMFYYNQNKIKDISQIFKISEGKVKIILYRVRKLIRKNLKERGYNYGK